MDSSETLCGQGSGWGLGVVVLGTPRRTRLPTKFSTNKVHVGPYPSRPGLLESLVNLP